MTSVTPAEGDSTWLKKRSSVFSNSPNNNTNGTEGSSEKKGVDKELARLKNIGAVSSVWSNKFVQEDNPGAKRLSFGPTSTTPKSPTLSIRDRRTLSENNKELADQITTVLQQDKDTSTKSLKEASATDKSHQQALLEASLREKMTQEENADSGLTEITEHNKQEGSEHLAFRKDLLSEECLSENVTEANKKVSEGDKSPLEKTHSEQNSKPLPDQATQESPKMADELSESFNKERELSTDKKTDQQAFPEDEVVATEIASNRKSALEKEGLTAENNEDEMKAKSDFSQCSSIKINPKEENQPTPSENTTVLTETESKPELEKIGPVTETSPETFCESVLSENKRIPTESTPEENHLLKEEKLLEKSVTTTPPKEDLDEAASLWFQYETLKTQNAQMNARLNKTVENIGFYKRQLESLNPGNKSEFDVKKHNRRSSSGIALSMAMAATANLDQAATLWFQCETLKSQNARISSRLNKANEDLDFFKHQLDSLDDSSAENTSDETSSVAEEGEIQIEKQLPSECENESVLTERELSDSPSIAPVWANTAPDMNLDLDEATSLWFQCETLKTQYAQIDARFKKANEEIQFYKHQLENLEVNTREGPEAAAESRDKDSTRVRQLAELIVKQDALMNEYEANLEHLNNSANQANSPDPQIQALRQELADLYKKKDEMEGAILALRAELEMAHSQMQLMMAVSSEIQNEFQSYKQKMDYGIKGMLEDQQLEHEAEIEALEQKFVIMAAETRQKEIEEALSAHLQELEQLKQQALDATETKEKEIACARTAHAQELEMLEKKLTEAAAQIKEAELALVRNSHSEELQSLEKKLTENATEDKEREIAYVRDVHAQELQNLETKLIEAATEAKELEIALVRDSHLQELKSLEKQLTEAAIEARKAEIAAANEAHSQELEALTQKLMAASTETKQREVVSGAHIQESESLRIKIAELTRVIEQKERPSIVTKNCNHSGELESLRKKIALLTSEVESKDKQIVDAVNEREVTLKMVLEQVAELKKLKEELCEMEKKSKAPVSGQSQDITRIVLEQVAELKKIKQELCERERLSRATLDEREIVSKIVLEQVIELKQLKDELCRKEDAIKASAEHSANTIRSLQVQVGQLNNTLRQKDQSIAELKKQMEEQKLAMEMQIKELNQSILEKDSLLKAQLNNDTKSELTKDGGESQRQLPTKNSYVYTTSSDEEENKCYSTDEELIQPTERFRSYNKKPSTAMYESSDEEDKQAENVQRFSYTSFHSASSVTPSTASQKEKEQKRNSVGSTLSHSSTTKEDWPMPPPTPPPSEPLPPLPMSPSKHEIVTKPREKTLIPPMRRGRSQTMVREETPSPYTTSIHQANELPRIVPVQKERKFDSPAPVPPPRRDIKRPILESLAPSLTQNPEQPLNTKWMDDPESEEEQSNEVQAV
ncbi:hypothetical protein BY458DRAFT_558395 [Sporodiniella umbellata]|nr:hypothetical protein BY458DRAFT_558395 [Sporodiniella umbellata]